MLKANLTDLQVVEISELVSSVQPPVKELEPLLIPILNDSKIDLSCGLCCDPSICSNCAEINKLLTIHCEDFEIGPEMELSAKPYYTDTTENSILVYTMQHISLEEKQRLLMIHVNDENLEKEDTVFSCLRFHRRPPAQPPPPREVIPVPLSTQVDHLINPSTTHCHP